MGLHSGLFYLFPLSKRVITSFPELDTLLLHFGSPSRHFFDFLLGHFDRYPMCVDFFKLLCFHWMLLRFYLTCLILFVTVDLLSCL